MRDLYKYLHVDAGATAEAIGAALANADPDVAEAARFVLLERRRRAVYDRNRELLATIGQLRAHLGLNYTRLWARREFKDFWRDLTPAAPNAERPSRRVDPMLIAGAFRAAGRHGRRHAARWQPWLSIFVVFVLVMAAIILWHVYR